MIKVYHGSNVVVREPLVGIGRENLDFGLGFYVTVLTTQADGWAANKARYYMQPEGSVSEYEFDFDAAVAAYRFHKFEACACSRTNERLHDEHTGLYLMSDLYIVDEVIMELQNKPRNN